MNQFNLYIGADNGNSNDPQRYTIASTLNDFFDGYTLTATKGYWKGNAEISTLVTIFTTKTRLQMVDIVVYLCKVLKQDCIILQSVESKVNKDQTLYTENTIDFVTPETTY